MPGTQVGPGVWRLGDEFVNWWLIGEANRFTLVDGGLPGQWTQLASVLAEAGAAVDAIEAVVLTHGHSDHFGIVTQLRSETNTKIHLHAADMTLARKKAKLPPPALLQLWRPGARKALVAYAKQGALRTPPVVDTAILTDDAPLDVPGRPRVVHTPGHTAGSCTLLLEDRAVAIVGDALVTLDPYTGRTGPRLLPSWDNEDHERAFKSLDVLATMPAGIVLPGHGEPWHGPIAEAAAAARRAGGAGPLR